jgi:membrane-bound lytic murein transglycosylase D
LPLVENAEVNKWIRQFKTAYRSTLLQWLAQGESLDHIIIPELEKHGVPKEFFYLAMIESGFNTHAKSPMAAAGAWQIMPATGRLYNLKINRFVDERKDPVKSSVAAAKLLRDLYHKFGDWYLTMAAYNAGPTLVQKAIIKGNTRDFWTLAQKSMLPRETSQYVPRWIAAYTVGSQPEKYGFQINEKTEFVMPSSYVDLAKTYNLTDIAKAINIKIETLKKWNPEILTAVTPPVGTGNTYRLRLDDPAKNLLESKLASIPFLDIRETYSYKINRGDTLRSIAKKHGVTLAEIIKLNPEIKPTNLRVGRAINLPTS